MAEEYPRDEFDDLPASRRVGAHRAAQRGGRSVRIVLGAVLVTAVIIAAVYGLLQISRSGSVFDDYTAAPAASDSASATPGETTSSEPEASEPAETSAAPEPSSASPSPSATVNAKSLQVTVYNGCTGSSCRSGTAAQVASDLTSSGWTVAGTANAPSSLRPGQNSVVYYTNSRYQDAAQQLAQELGIASVRAGSGLSTPLTVVLGNSFGR